MDTKVKVKVILDTRRDRAAETVTTQFSRWAAQLRCKVGGGYNVSPSVCQAEPGKNSMTNRQIFRGEEKTHPHQNLWVGLPRVTALKLCFQRFWLISNRRSSGGQISKSG